MPKLHGLAAGFGVYQNAFRTGLSRSLLSPPQIDALGTAGKLTGKTPPTPRGASSFRRRAGICRGCLGSTAFTAAGLLAADAVADGVKLEIDGHFKSAVGAVLSGDYSASSGANNGDLRDYVIKQDVEIHFRGETELENGLTVGVEIELDGQTSDDQIASVYGYLDGSFGELRFGDTEEAYAQLCYQVPSASALFGADSPDFNFSNAGIAGYAATNGTCYGVDDNSTKLVYFSPSFAGFQLAASFTPDNTEDTRNTLAGAGTRFKDDPGQNSENLSIAASFMQDFDGVRLVLGGGATFSFDKEDNPNDTENARGYNAYAQVAFFGFTIGAASELRQNLADDGHDRWVYGVGAAYAWSGWTAGLGWTRGDYEGVTGASGVGPFNADHDVFSATISYELGPGISLDGVVEYSDYRSHDAAGPDYQALAAGIGTDITF
ncbi:MAG: porin [Dongiaceae bacterium]